MEPNNTTKTPPNRQIVFGLIALLLGAAIVGLAMGIIPLDESKFRAPHWVVGLAGSTFALAGLSLLLQGGFEKLFAESGSASIQKEWLSLLQSLLAACIVTALCLVAGWVAFAEGERQFSSTASMGPIGISGPASDTVGRIVFGVAAVLTGLLAVYAWYRFFSCLSACAKRISR
jgi:hypothetical protein